MKKKKKEDVFRQIKTLRTYCQKTHTKINIQVLEAKVQ